MSIRNMISSKMLFKCCFFLCAGLILLPACYYDSEELLYPSFSNECDTTDIGFSETIIPLLENHCWSCHSNAVAASLGNSIFLEEHNDIVSRQDAIIGAINHRSPYSPMPKGTPKLSDCKIRTFELWFETGALQ